MPDALAWSFENIALARATRPALDRRPAEHDPPMVRATRRRLPGPASTRNATWGTPTGATVDGMCNRYVSPEAGDAERFWHIGPGRGDWRGGEVFPRKPGPFIRQAIDGDRELVVGQWGLIPWFAKEPKVTYSTNNARGQELAAKATFKQPWARGQRCIIPAWAFDEPNWESGKNIWWRFRRADGMPWGLAGLWSRWTDKATGEIHESYTMLTINADAHELMRRMHKPDPKLQAHEQDKRSVVPIELADVDQWLAGSQDEAQKLLKLTPVEVFDARPMTAGI